MALTTLDEKFAHDLGDIYDAEHRFLEAQQGMLSQAHAPELKSMIREHIEQTQEQIRNLDEVYRLIGALPRRVKCDAAVGLVTEGQKSMQEAAIAPSIRDCVIAGAAAKVEHYEIASYQSLILLSQKMGRDNVVGLLERNLHQEEQTARRVVQSMPSLLHNVSGPAI